VKQEKSVKQEKGEAAPVHDTDEEPRRGELSNPSNEYRRRYTKKRKEVKNVR